MTSNPRRLIGVGLALFSIIAGSISASRPAAAGSPPFPNAISLTATLVASVGTGLGYFGADVAAEGGVIAVGTPYVLIPGVRRRGAVYVYERPSGGWMEEPAESAILVTSLSFQHTGQFGTSIDMSGDVIVVGEPDVVRNQEGSRAYSRAFVYVKPPTGWSGVLTESAVLRVRHQTGDGPNGMHATLFGQSVAMSGDAIVVGDATSGVAYLFKKPVNGWSGTIFESARLVDPAPPDPNHRYADNVVMDGRTVVVSSSDFVPQAENYRAAGVVFVKPPSGEWGRGDVTASAVLSGGFGAQANRLNAMDIRGDTVAMSSIIFSAVFVRPPGGWVDAGPDAQLTGTSLYWPLAIASSSTILVAGGRISGGSQTVSAFRRPITGWSGDVGSRRRILFGGVDRVASIAVDGRTALIGALGSTFFDNVGRVFIAELSNDLN